MKHNITTGALHVSGNSRGQTADKRDWIEQGRKQGMVQGIALAVSQYLKYYGEHPGILEIWRDSGLSLEECRENGVDEYDMETLEKYESMLDK